MKNPVDTRAAAGDDAKLSQVSEADGHLIARAKKGDREALNLLLASARPRMLAMARLSPVHREVIALREMDGESYQDIASIARCPVGTVMSRLHHARRRLAVELAPAFAA